MLWSTSTRLSSIIRVSHTMHGLCYVSHALYLNHTRGMFIFAVFPVFIYLLLCGTWFIGNHTFTMIVTHCLLHCLQNWCRHRIFLLYNYFVITILMYISFKCVVLILARTTIMKHCFSIGLEHD